MDRDCFMLNLKTFGSLFFLILITVSCTKAEPGRPDRMVGGACQYKSYPGTAKVLAFEKIPAKKAVEKGGGDEYDVRFIFYPETTPIEKFAQVEGKTHRLVLMNGSLPKEGFLKKYGISPGKTLPCHLDVIVKGTCTPVVFQFPTVDLTDYEANQ